MEPVIRNISHNVCIEAVANPDLNFMWPTVLGYADDITVLTSNKNDCVQEIFDEYQRLTAASGLKLNADKTEKFNITGLLVQDALTTNNVAYGNQNYLIHSKSNIKINGIYYDLNVQRMAALNYDNMKEKMNRHFKQWSKRDLSLLGKIQIIKTFGMSQYLYALAVVDLVEQQWVEVNKLIFKFLWNRDYNARPAPHRIKKSIMTTPRELGGFGMVDMRQIIEASWLRQFAILKGSKCHPIANLQEELGAYEYLRLQPKLNIDMVVSTLMCTLRNNAVMAQLDMMPGLADSDMILHRQVLHAKLKWVVMPLRRNSIEYNMLRARRYVTVGDVIKGTNGSVQLLSRIVLPALRELLMILDNEYREQPLPDRDVANVHVYDKDTAQWLNVSMVGSSITRKFLNKSQCILNTKLADFTVDEAIKLYRSINKLINVQNKTKMYRLLHGDVYCGSRLVHFGLSNIDTCIRCFETETIQHLLTECPYSRLVWDRLGVEPGLMNILDTDLSQSAFEIRAEIVNLLVFRKVLMPPDVLIQVVMKAYADRLCYKRAVTMHVQTAVENFITTRSWRPA